MNLLAHAHLGSIYGRKVNCVNILWDFLAKDMRDDKRDFVISGGKLHNRIDSLTDSSDEFKKAKRLVSPEKRKIAGIIIDIGFDYVLSQNWNIYSTTNLDSFIEEVLFDLFEYAPELCSKADIVQEYMYQCDWFGDYQDINRLHRVFQRISRRFSRSELFINAENEIINNLEGIEELFHLFYRKLLPSVS